MKQLRKTMIMIILKAWTPLGTQPVEQFSGRGEKQLLFSLFSLNSTSFLGDRTAQGKRNKKGNELGEVDVIARLLWFSFSFCQNTNFPNFLSANIKIYRWVEARHKMENWKCVLECRKRKLELCRLQKFTRVNLLLFFFVRNCLEWLQQKKTFPRTKHFPSIFFLSFNHFLYLVLFIVTANFFPLTVCVHPHMTFSCYWVVSKKLVIVSTFF